MNKLQINLDDPVKRCRICGKIKNLREFYKNVDTEDGWKKPCRQCTLKQKKYNRCIDCGKWICKKAIRCMSCTNKGKRNCNYKDGHSTLDFNEAFDTTHQEWKNIAKRIRKRDDYTCQVCRETGYEVHHIIPRRLGIDNSESNLITLCKSCHKKVEYKWQDWVNYFTINLIQNQ